MKKILIPFVALVAFSLLSSCNALPENGYKLNGEIKNYPNQYIYLTTGNFFSGTTVTDSCIVKDGKFSFTGTINEPTSAIISDMVYNMNNYLTIKYSIFYIDAADMNYSIDWSSEFDSQKRIEMPYTLTGSVTNEEALKLIKIMSSDSLANNDDYMLKCLEGFIKTHPDSYISAYNLSIYSSMLSLEEIERLYAFLSEKAKTFSCSKEIVDRMELMKSIQPGKPASDFTTKDINGKTVSLSDFRGKTILLDFWASWCVPCRKSMPHVKALYKKYGSKGLVVVCVSDDDSDHDKWRKAVEKDGTSEFVHVLRGLKTTEYGGFDKSEDISAGFDVHYLPTKYLIGADGNFISCKVDDEELDAKLKEIFGF